MKDTDANVHLIRHMIGLLEEFIHENNPDDFSSDDEVKQAFWRFVKEKEAA